MYSKFKGQKAGLCNCANMRRAARAITKIYDHSLEPSGLKSMQLAALAHINHDGPLNITALAGIMVLDRTTLVRNIKFLEVEGYIDNLVTSDSRERQITLTEKGKEALKNGLPLWKKVQDKMRSSLGDEDLAALSRIVENLESLASAVPNSP